MPVSDRKLSKLLRGNDVEVIAQKLLQATITTRIDNQLTSGIIVETEAYKAPQDKGSHAFGNKRTKRTETLFSSPGTAYVYLCYGIHHLFNVVTGPKGTAHAVLIRAIEPVGGHKFMIKRRKLQKIKKNISNGPGKLAQALGITTALNNGDLQSEQCEISIELPEKYLPKSKIIASPRVGIGYAEECALWPWRFRIKDNPWTSLPDVVNYPNHT